MGGIVSDFVGCVLWKWQWQVYETHRSAKSAESIYSTTSGEKTRPPCFFWVLQQSRTSWCFPWCFPLVTSCRNKVVQGSGISENKTSMSLYSILSCELTISHPKAFLKMIFLFPFGIGRIMLVVVEGVCPFGTCIFFWGVDVRKKLSSTSPFSNPTEVFSTIPKGCETHGFLGVVFGDASDPSDGLEDEYESTYGIQEVDNGIKMGFVTTTKYHGMQERQPCHMLAENFVGCLTGLSNWCCMVSSNIFTWNFLPSIIVQPGRWRASASLLLGDCVYVYNIYIDR